MGALKWTGASADCIGVVKTARAAGDAPDPVVEPRRFQVVVRGVIDRPRAVVWDEYEQDHHPAWSDYREEDDPARRVGDVAGLAVGAAEVMVMPVANGSGVRNVAYSEVQRVDAGFLVVRGSIVPGVYEATEMTQLWDHPSGGTLVDLSNWVNTAPTDATRAARLHYNMDRIQREYLARAQAWRPGAAHRPVVIAPEPEDLPAGWQ